MIIDGSMIISGFVSKVVNDCVDIVKDKIKSADKNRKSYNQNMETRIYQVTIDAINVFTDNTYEGQDVLYDAAEYILAGLRTGKDNIEAARAGLKILGLQVMSDTCEDFLEALCYEICKKENRDLAIEVIILQQEQTNGYIQEGFRRSYLSDEEINRKLDYLIKELINKKVYEKRYNSENIIENRAEKYAQNWDENVFLNNYDEEDERTGDRVNIKLKDIYLEELLPSYKLNMNQGLSDNLKRRLEKYIVDKSDREMLLILGQPGIGKSTLITWIMTNLVKKKDEIFVFQFASDLKKVNWQGENTLGEIFKVLCMDDEGLKNKVLILDGFDEISIRSDRERILNKLYKELKGGNRLGNFSLIITCRENYVNKSLLVGLTYITLQAWNENQIKIFCEIYEKKSSGNLEAKFSEAKINGILKNKEIFGIPLILYMILALDITIEENSSIGDVYDNIFSLERGEIYNRCYDAEHRINEPKIKRCIHQVSQRIAFWIFENNADEAFIYQKDFQEICDTVLSEAKEKNENIESDALIGSYFIVNHCEGELADEIHFVHRSIYEYFVAVYFFESIHELRSKEKVAGKLGEFLSNEELSEQMLEFIKYKFNSMKGVSLPEVTKEIFNIMLRDGMTYHIEAKEPCDYVIERELIIFSNMLEIVHLWNSSLEKIYERIILYIRFGGYLKGLNLRGFKLHCMKLHCMNEQERSFCGRDLSRICLREADLREADLSFTVLIMADLRKANLSGADLSGADLRGADLSGADLRGADLKWAILIEADLRGANLSGVDLTGTPLCGADLSGADLKEANLIGSLSRKAFSRTVFDENQVNYFCTYCDLKDSMVYLSGTKEVISYTAYCIRKRENRI